MNKTPFLVEKMSRLTLVIVLVTLSECQKPTALPPTKPILAPTPTVANVTNKSTPTKSASTSTSLKVTATPTPAPTGTSTATPSNNFNVPPFQDPSQPVEVRVADLLGRMSLEEKIGQMAQVEKGSINQPHDITTYFLGSILSGGRGSPAGNNTPSGWMDMVEGFQTRALNTHLGIPLIYGVDAVHGHGNLYGATIFPHNIGLGATRDPDLVEQIGRATAEEMAATGIRWNFAPVVAVVQDIRWGRTYEGYSENTQVVSDLSSAYIRGLQNVNGKLAVLATPKHFIGDGGTAWGSSATGNYILDQGNVRMDEATLRKLFLPPYQSAIENGALSIMVSFSSWNGVKMHAQKYLLTDVLKGELGFKGFIVSDWQAIGQISPSYYQALVSSINAGIDLVMIPYDYKRFTTTITQAVTNKAIPIERLDDAVSRILTVKFKMGLFEKPYTNPSNIDLVSIPEHRSLAREAVRKSLVLLKNENLGDFPFTGKLPYTWPRWNNQLPFNFKNLATEGCGSPLFPFGYGLGEAGSEPIMWLDCPGY